MYYLEAPTYLKPIESLPKVFLAGGITGCPDWQSEMVKKLTGENIYVFNPRRKDFDVNDKNATPIQIKWERDFLTQSDVISFWFCKDQIQPISLFELGKYGFSGKHKIVIGVDPGYPRKQDIYYQTKLEMPDMKIFDSLDDLAKAIVEECNTIRGTK